METNRQRAFFSAPIQEGFWEMLLFFSILSGYCFYYAPFGINETDGGFVTGLAWQILNGKALYGDVIYVRPPLPVWLRSLELLLLPDTWAVLGERWIFYLKMGCYAWLGAAILTSGSRRWRLATLGFIVSVHCYPPAAWHTTDGILFAVLGIWLLAKNRSWWGSALAGIAFLAALLCKQSFYPLAAVFAVLLFAEKDRKRAGWGGGAFLAAALLFTGYLYRNGLLENFIRLTASSATGGQALQHGVLDYFRIKPALALATIVLLPAVAWSLTRGTSRRPALWCWWAWLALLAATYAFELCQQQEFTVPFAQVRLLFWAGIGWATYRISVTGIGAALRRNDAVGAGSTLLYPLALLAVSWCAAVSWGYNLPVLFSTPWVFAAMEISRALQEKALPGRRPRRLYLAAVAILLVVFRLGYEFVYRDGRRSDMHTHLGGIYPQLGGIYSTPEKAALYRELKMLAGRYPVFKTLPSFPQASFLTRTLPPFPLDWVVRRETGADSTLVLKNLRENRPVLFIEKKYGEKIGTDPELALTRRLLETGTILEETSHFWVVKPE